MKPIDPPDTIRETAAETTGQAIGREATAFSPIGYDVGELLGRGGMGEVVVARDRTIGREVAIKRMRSAEPDPEAVDRFLREAKIQALLDHPAIVPVHALGRDAEDRPYFTMKRLAGTTLFDLLARRARVPLQQLLRPFIDVCLAIDFAHARGVVHRDLKPTNIMLGDYGEVYVLDWGLARVLGERVASISALPVVEPGRETQAGDLLGTPGYMAPEQIRSASDAGPAADLYSLGTILFEILAGQPLHPQPDAVAHTLAQPDASPAVRAPDREIPPELDVLCVATLAPDPAARPTARQLADRVQSYLDGDRDLARRRTLAHEHLGIAHAAIVSGDPERRIVALRAANHALALDPESTGAATMVMSLVLEPPDELPPALVRHLANDELDLLAQQAGPASLALATPLLFWPVAILLGVTSWLPLLAASVLIGLMIALTWFEVRTRRPMVLPWLACNALLLVLFGRVFGPWILVPALAGGLAMTLLGAPGVGSHPRKVLAALALGYVAPIALEAAGVLTRTWELTGGKLLTWSASLEWHGGLAVAFLIVANLTTFVVIGLFARSLADSRREAHRKVEIQRWHLAQLVPAEAHRGRRVA